MKTEIKIFKRLIVIPILLYAIFSMLMINFAFGYLNQSSLTPKEEQLTFINYLLPLILTIGFIFYSTIKNLLGQKTSIKRNWMLIFALFIGAVIAIPWQIRNIQWQFQSETINFIELIPYLIGITFTFWAIIEELKIKNGTQHRI